MDLESLQILNCSRPCAFIASLIAPAPIPMIGSNVQQTVELHLAWDKATALWGKTIRLSEGGAIVHLHQPLPPSAMGVSLTCRLLEAGIDLSGQIVDMPNQTTLKIYFDPLTCAQYRQLVALLFCEPNRWQWQKAPSELQTLWLLLRTLISPPLSRHWMRILPSNPAKAWSRPYRYSDQT